MVPVWVHQAVAFAIASEFCRKRPFARNFRSEDQSHSQNQWHSLANSFATLHSQLLFEIWWLKFASQFRGASYGGHLKPVTLKPVSRIFCAFHVFVSAFSAFYAFLCCGVSSDPCFFGVRGNVRSFHIFVVSGSNR